MISNSNRILPMRCLIISCAFFCCSLESVGQNVVTGMVKDALGEPLIGVSIYIKGSSIGTSSDIEGKFSLSIPIDLKDSPLVFSAIGYLTQETSIGLRSYFTITLIEDTRTLSEIVVTGYVSEKKENVTGAVATVSASNLVKLPVPTLDQALQGRVPGVVVTQNTGAPGDGVGIRIRGVGSINSGNNPLYVVDGIPTLDISAFNLQDVADLTVLKDASAAALYGSRAANGVVIITTKSGKGSAPKIELNSQVGVQSPTRLIEMTNTEDYVQLYNEAATNDNVGKDGIFLRPLITETMADDFDDIDYTKEILREAVLQSHNISISGSEGKTNYLLSGSYFSQEGIIKSSDFTRITGRINLETQLKDWLSTGINLNVTKSKANLIPSSGDGAGGNGGSVVRYAFFRTPAIPIYDSNGDFTDRPELFRFLGDGYNPVGLLAYNQNERHNERTFGKFYIRVNPLKGLVFVTNFGVDLRSQNSRRFDRNWGTLNRINNPNRLTISNTRFQGITLSNFATYDRVFGSHNFNFLVGTEAIKNSNYGVVGTDNSFFDQNRSLVFLGNGKGIKTTSQGESGNALLSFFGKVGYDYKGKYLTSMTVRRDGSSRFGPDNRWGTFYAGSLGWRLEQESFLSSVTWIDRLMLRTGYGRIGNQEITDYPAIAKVGTNYFYPYGNVSSIGYAINQLGNSKVKWETSNQFNMGVDFEIWSGSLFITVDYFRKVTSDLLVSQPIASSSGFATPSIINNGEVLNRGIEVAVTHSKSIGDFQYTISANAATLHNEVLDVNPVIQGGAIGSDNITLVEKGYPIGSFYILEMEGIFQNAADIFTHANQGDNIKPGDIKFKDQNGDNFITGEDRAHLGSPIPDVTAAVNISLNYKNWDMSVFFQGAYGQEIFSVLNRDIEGFYRPFNVTQRYFDNRWTGEGTSNEFPRASWDGSGNNIKSSTRFLEDGSYTRLKNLQIGYTFSSQLLSRYGFSNLRVFVSGTNLLTFTKYGGLDPEMTVSDNALEQGDRAAGMDWGTYPSSRAMNLGFSLTF